MRKSQTATAEDLLKGIPHETEEEIWKGIDSLSAMRANEVHWVGKGDLDNSNGQITEQHRRYFRIQLALVTILEQKFNVVAPTSEHCSDPIPKGKIGYNDWYEKMKFQFYGREYDELLNCGSCPYRESKEDYVDSGATRYPCKIEGRNHKVSPEHVYQVCPIAALTRDRDARHAYFSGDSYFYQTSEGINTSYRNQALELMAGRRKQLIALGTEPEEIDDIMRQDARKRYQELLRQSKRDSYVIQREGFLAKLKAEHGWKAVLIWRRAEQVALKNRLEVYRKKEEEKAQKSK